MDESKKLDYRIVYLDEKDSIHPEMLSKPDEIFVAATQSQALELAGSEDYLKKVDSYVHRLEDAFLGERFEKFPINKQYMITDEWFLSGGLINDERHDHTLLEFLQVLVAQDREHPFETEVDEYGCVKFDRFHRFRLRNILFNNPSLTQISNKDHSSEELWAIWKQRYEDDLSQAAKGAKAKNDNEDAKLSSEIIDSYKSQIGDFSSFVTVVKLLRSWSIDFSSKREWTTKFMFPCGPNCLFTEIDKKNTNKGTLLGGQGEVLFSMLQRAYNHGKRHASDKLGKDLFDLFLSSNDPIDSYAQIIQAVDEERGNRSRTDSEFLAYKHLDVFDHLYEDISNLMECSLGRQDLFNAISLMSVLNLIVFELEQEYKMREGMLRNRVNYALNDEVFFDDDLLTKSDISGIKTSGDVDGWFKKNLSYSLVICLDNKNKAIKDESNSSYLPNKKCSEESIKAYVRYRLDKFIELIAPYLRYKPRYDDDDRELITEIVLILLVVSKSEFNNPESKKDQIKALRESLSSCKNYNDLTSKVEKVALSRASHRNQLHTSWARFIGLLSGSRVRKPYYTISDDLLKSLVRSYLGKRPYMKLTSFLEHLKARYHFIISKQSIGNDVSNETKEALALNETSLKEKLQDLNMLITLSDYCEYIQKP